MEEIVTKWAECILIKFNWNKNDEYKKLEIMNCIMSCFQEILKE